MYIDILYCLGLKPLKTAAVCFRNPSISSRTVTPSPRTSQTQPPSTLGASVPESESGASTTSTNETPEPQSHSTDTDAHNPENEVSFVSVDDEKGEYQEELLLDFSDEERNAIFRVRKPKNLTRTYD